MKNRRLSWQFVFKGKGWFSLILLLTVMTALPCAAESPDVSKTPAPEPLETGGLLFIPAPDRCEVYLDGRLKGITPLLLVDMESGSHLVEIRSPSRVGRLDILVTDTIFSVVSVEPVMEPYTGSLAVTSVPDDVEVKLNGEVLGRTPLSIDCLRTGTYTLALRREGFLPVETSIEIVWDKKTTLDFPMTEAYRLTFDPIPPEDARIMALDNQGKHSSGGEYLPGEEIILPVGTWELTVSGSTFHPVTQHVSITSSDLIFPFAPELYYGEVVFPGLGKKSMVLLDGKDITGEIADGRIRIPAGFHTVTIQTESYMPMLQNFFLEKDQEISCIANLIKDPVYVRNQRQKTGTPIVLTGLVLSAGGYIFNMDSVVLNMTENYNDYVTVKYSTLGVLGAGLVLSSVGGLLLLTAP